MECVTRWKRIVNGPLVTCEPGVISCRSARSVTPCSSSFPAISAEGEARRVDLQLELAEQVRQRADVVLVAVRQHHGLDLVRVLAQVLEVGQDQVDAGHLGLGERQAGVQHQDAAVHLEGGHVAADLADAAEEDEARIVRVGGGRGHG